MLLDKIHSAVEFQAFFIANEKEQVHHEKSLFVKIKVNNGFLPILVFHCQQ